MAKVMIPLSYLIDEELVAKAEEEFHVNYEPRVYEGKFFYQVLVKRVVYEDGVPIRIENITPGIVNASTYEDAQETSGNLIATYIKNLGYESRN